MAVLFYLIQWLALVIGSSIIQRNWGVPLPITLLVGVIVGNAVGLPLFNARISDHQFDLLVMLTLPLLIAADALKMRWKDIRRHGVSLFMTAGVNVFIAFSGRRHARDAVQSRLLDTIPMVLRNPRIVCAAVRYP